MLRAARARTEELVLEGGRAESDVERQVARVFRARAERDAVECEAGAAYALPLSQTKVAPADRAVPLARVPPKRFQSRPQ
jgi:hypothetical protein